MNIDDLKKVTELNDELNKLIERHDQLKLMRIGKNESGYTQYVRIGIGGDNYGNGEYSRITVPLVECKQAIDALTKDIDKVWGRIVTVRADLRILGVSLEDNKS